ncbi:hypothetical protein JCM8202_000632 [Rhodotorula sphaerocarpa]
MESSTESFVLVGRPAAAGAAGFPPGLSPPPRLEADQIAAARTLQPDGALAIDHLLALALDGALGEGAQAVQWPPASQVDLDALVQLLDRRAQSDQPAPLVARSCLYYLALACSKWQEEVEALQRAHDHAQSVLLLPLPFRLAVRALHALDAGHYHDALDLLVHPAVTPDFVPRTVALLATRPEPARDRSRLVLDYWTLARLDLARYSVTEAAHIVRALCAPDRKRGVAQAWELARDWHVPAERPLLWTAVLETCFGENYTGLPVPHHLSALLALPFAPEEDALVTAFCLAPTPTASNLKRNPALPVDWRLSKLVAESRPVDALEFFARAKHVFTHRGEAERLENDARERLLRAVEANLTAVEKARLQLELVAIGKGGGGGATGQAAKTTSGGTSLAALTQPAWAPAAPASRTAPTAAAPSEAAPSRGDASATMIVVEDEVEPSPEHGAQQLPPRTLAELRQQRQPPAPAPAPTAADLPLSASPFVRRQQQQSTASSQASGPAAGSRGGSDVLRALQQQNTPRKGDGSSGGFAGPLGVTSAATGSPFRLQALHHASSAGVNGTSDAGTMSARTGGPGSASLVSVSGTGSGLLRPASDAVSRPTPTLPGFGSVRRPVAPASVAAAQQVAAEVSTPVPRRTAQTSRREQRELTQEDEGEEADGNGDAAMSEAAGSAEDRAGEDVAAEDFAHRAARDPAVQRTIQAASSRSKDERSPQQQQQQGATAQAEAEPEDADPAERASKRGATPARRTTRRADKRRAVQGQPPNENRVDASRTEDVRLPPGAFPGQGEEDDDDQGATDQGAGGAQGQEARGEKRSTTRAKGRSSSSSAAGQSRSGKAAPATAAPATPARASSRRTTRSRASTAEPTSPPPSTVRRSTRASSVQAHEPDHASRDREASAGPEMRQVRLGASLGSGQQQQQQSQQQSQGKTPIRRSSRLRSGGQAAEGRKGGRGKIDEASEEE